MYDFVDVMAITAVLCGCDEFPHFLGYHTFNRNCTILFVKAESKIISVFYLVSFLFILSPVGW